MSDWSQAELVALERGAPMSVMARIRAAREVQAAAAKVSPESVNYGIATGLSRCGLCRFYEPSPANAMTGTCEIVAQYRVERNTTCDLYEPPAPSTSGDRGGTVARAAREFRALVATAGVPSGSALIASNAALVGRNRLLRASAEQRYGPAAPKVFARWCGFDG